MKKIIMNNKKEKIAEEYYDEKGKILYHKTPDGYEKEYVYDENGNSKTFFALSDLKAM